MNKLVFKIINLIGTLLIILGFLVPVWKLDVKMGQQTPSISAKIYQNFNLSKLNGNFSSFDSTLAVVVKYLVIGLLIFAILVTILSFVDVAIDEDHKKILYITTLVFAFIVCALVVAIFVIDIIFVRLNTIEQVNGYTLRPIMQNGMYFIIMGGFFNGLFMVYSIIMDKKR